MKLRVWSGALGWPLCACIVVSSALIQRRETCVHEKAPHSRETERPAAQTPEADVTDESNRAGCAADGTAVRKPERPSARSRTCRVRRGPGGVLERTVPGARAEARAEGRRGVAAARAIAHTLVWTLDLGPQRNRIPTYRIRLLAFAGFPRCPVGRGSSPVENAVRFVPRSEKRDRSCSWAGPDHAARCPTPVVLRPLTDAALMCDERALWTVRRAGLA